MDSKEVYIRVRDLLLDMCLGSVLENADREYQAKRIRVDVTDDDFDMRDLPAVEEVARAITEAVGDEW